MPGRLLFSELPHHLRHCSSSNLVQIRLRACLLTFEQFYSCGRCFLLKNIIFSFDISPLCITYIVFRSPAARGSCTATVSLAPLSIPPTAVQTCSYFLPPSWMCALRDSSIPHNPAFSLLHFYGFRLPVLSVFQPRLWSERWMLCNECNCANPSVFTAL